MMDISAAELFKTYDLAAALVGKHPELASDFKAVQRQFDDKRNQSDASIMVYGVYNAGKSTLINALIGQQVAATGDIPLTNSINAYSWNNVTILDTPGVDAPKAHEKVTREQLLKADAVIFVANPSGAAEEEKTLQALVDILQAKKKLFLVLNEKDKADVDTFTRLKNDIRIRLQDLAEAKGMQDVLGDIPIMLVNAETALRAKQENKEKLLQLSGFPALEAGLTSFINSIDSQHIYARLSGELSKFLDHVLLTLERNTTSETVRSYDSLLKKIIEQQQACRKNVFDEIKRQSKVMYQGCKSALHQDSGHAQPKIEALFIQASEQIEAVQKYEMGYLIQRFEDDVDSLEAAILRQSKTSAPGALPQAPVDQSSDTNTDSPEKSDLNIETINQAIGSLSSLAKPEHVVSTLKLVKDWLPSVMKGIGPKTMEKWGAAVVGKWIPYVGPAITVISSLWDIFAEDGESKKAREQSEQHRREWERFQQEVEDFASTTAAQFEANAGKLLSETLDPWFKALLDKVKASRNLAAQQDEAISETVFEVQQLASQLRSFS
ncbi:dynamin family protein [Cedecea davisae]|uniref:dynamin family protein n=1 Tax=Cedecea davisae TaxID=158484 RepID=UPI00376EFC0E